MKTEIEIAADGILALSQLSKKEQGKVAVLLMKRLTCRVAYDIIKKAVDNLNLVKAGF